MKIQFKNYKHFIMRLCNLALIICICLVYHNIALVRAQKEAKIEAENQKLSAAYKDGI